MFGIHFLVVASYNSGHKLGVQGVNFADFSFLFYSNEAEKQLTKCKIITYPDDTVIYYHDKDLKSIEEVLSTEFNLLSDWLMDNELILNLKQGKTEVMIFGTKARLSKTNHQVNIEHQSSKLNVTESYKYLGVEIDPSLNLSSHFNSV